MLRPKAWCGGFHFLENWTDLPKVGELQDLAHIMPGTVPPRLTFSFLQARAAALFSASALRRPLATKVMGQGQSRVRVDSLVLVPTVWNCMRFYMEGKRNGYRKAEKAVLRIPRNPAMENEPPSQQVPNIGHTRWATGQQKPAPIGPWLPRPGLASLAIPWFRSRRQCLARAATYPPSPLCSQHL